MKLVSESLSLDDYDEAVELFFERGWTDGLPVVLPTRGRVEAMIAHVGRDPQESLGPIPPKGGEAPSRSLPSTPSWAAAGPSTFPWCWQRGSDPPCYYRPAGSSSLDRRRQ